MNTREMLVEYRVRCAVRLHLVADTKKRHSITYKHGDVHGAPWLQLLVCGVNGFRPECHFRSLCAWEAWHGYRCTLLIPYGAYSRTLA
jgi:hypothetical protein